MWEITNRTPYAANRSWVRDKAGVHLWLVAVKATFDLHKNGKVSLADEQAPALIAPEFWGDPGSTSLRAEADVVPTKPATDILVEGSAYAPSGRATSKVNVSLRAGDIEKSLVVHGPRAYYITPMGGLGVTPGHPFVTRAIKYEDAYGGADLVDADPRKQRYDARNPVGKGVAADARRLAQTPAHAIEYRGVQLLDKGPAGFGPLASFWEPRRERGGTYDEAWSKRKKPLLPDDYSDTHLLCAPDDQRPNRHLHGDELFALENLTPEGRLQFALPKIYLTFTTQFGTRQEEHRSRLGAVIIEPDAMKLKLVWNTHIPVRNGDVDYLDTTTIQEKPYLP